MNLRRIFSLVKKELRQTRRDKGMLKAIFLIPIIEVLFFGYVVSTDIHNISTAVLDEDHTAASRQFVRNFTGSGYFVLNHFLGDQRQMESLLETGEIQVILRIPQGFGKNIDQRRTAVVQTILDGTDSMTARIIAGYAEDITRHFSSGIAIKRLERLKSTISQLPGITPAIRVWFNPELRSVNFMIPGVLCIVLLIITTAMTSMAIVKEKELGTLEQLIVTPIKPIELMLGKTLPFLFLGMIDTVLILLVATFWFGVIPAGNLFLLLGSTLIFLMTTLGLGIFISTVSQTQQEATMTLFFLMLPSILLTGFIFPIENMPHIFQMITYFIPVRYFLTAMRALFLKGVGLEAIWSELLILAFFGVLILTLSARRFSKRLG